MYQCPNFIDEETDVDLRKAASCVTVATEAMGSEIPIEELGTDTPAIEETETDSAITDVSENGFAKTERRAPAITSVIETESSKTERSSTASEIAEKTITATDASGSFGVKVKVKVRASERNSDKAADKTKEVEETEAQAPIFETPSSMTAEPEVEGPPEEAAIQSIEPTNDDFVDSQSHKFVMEEEIELKKNPHAQSTKLASASAGTQQDFLTDHLLSPSLLDRIIENLSFFLKPLCELYYQLQSKSVALKGYSSK